jgi:hypothetical protein
LYLGRFLSFFLSRRPVAMGVLSTKPPGRARGCEL